MFLFNNLTLCWCKCNMTDMKNIFLFISFLFVFFLPQHSDAYVDRQNAVVRIMNKAAGKVQLASLPVGKEAKYEKLKMIVRSCKQTDPFDPENFYMFIEISMDESQIFSGWMSANEPGDNPLQNADYDVWLVSCEA